MNRFVAVLLLSSCALFAQTNRGSIAGTVSDSSGAVVPGASIKLVNMGTAEERTLKTSESGTYAFLDLEPVQYRVEVGAQGFKKSIVDKIKVDTASNTTVNVKLEPGSIDTKITVEAEPVLVNTESGTSSNTITERQLQDVPLVNRSVLDLAMTLPNVSGEPGSESPGLTSGTACPGCNLSVGGGRPLSTTIMADGTNNTGVSLGRSMVTFSPETVQEFTVQTSAFSAEYGNTGGGVINVTTKSGTNELHGTALWYVRNPAFAAAPWQTGATNRSAPTLKYNQFSLAAGGPVYIPKLYNGRNKTFWFAAIEPYYRRDHLDQYADMPTDAMWKGDFSDVAQTSTGYWLPKSVISQYGLATQDSVLYNEFNQVGNQFTQQTLASGKTYAPFPGNIIPASMLDTVAQKVKSMITPGGAYFQDSNGNISNLMVPRVLQQDEKRYTVRIDQVITDRDRINGRFTLTPIVKRQGTPLQPTNYGATYSWAKQIMMAETHTFSPTLFNDIRLNYTRGRFSDTIDPAYDVTTGENLNTQLGLPSITKGGLPSFNGLFYSKSFGNGSSTATGFGGAGSTQVDDKEERYAITDIVYKNIGSMSLKFGVDLSHQLQNVLPLYGSFGGIYAFTNYTTDSNGASSGTGGAAFASFLLGVPGSSTPVTLRSVAIPYYYRWNSAAGFIQDDWKIRPNLTLNIGLRYALQMPRTEKYDHQGVFRPDLAKTAQLATPYTMADGSVLSSYQQIPFAYSGIGGNSRSLTPPQYTDFEPRFGFAWSPKFLQERHVTLRGGWGLSHAPLTGFARSPNPDFGATYQATVMPTYDATTGALTTASSTANGGYVLRLGENPPVINATTVANQIYLGAQPSNGLTYVNSLYLQQTLGGYAVSQNYHTPYANNWNVTAAWQANRSTTVEIGYQGSMGIHLFMPGEDINPKNSNVLSAELAANISTTGTISDPAGRVNPLTGKAIAIQNGTLGSPYLGFSSLYQYYDASANSIRHAGFVNVVHRVSRGLTFTANYTLGKSIDTASSAGGDKNVLTTGQSAGQVALGGTRANDRSVSLYDQKHVIHGSAIYDLPFGRGRKFLANAWKPLDYAVGGWTITGLERINSGVPFMAYLSDSNQLGDATYAARPDVVNGATLLNPLWSRSCPVGTGCQPYLNPSAFERPALGVLGTASRTIDGLRGPWDRYFDLSLQKNFRIGEGGKRQLQFRMDALNVLNHPTFAPVPNPGSSAYQFMGAPSTSDLTTAAYDIWAAANNQPKYATTDGAAIYNSILSMVNNQKMYSSAAPKGVLPSGFYNVQLPSNFFGNAATSYDIRTLQGYKYYQLRTAYNTGFGDMYQNGSSRYIQFGVKLFF